MRVLEVTTGIAYSSLKAACEALNLEYTRASRLSKNHQKIDGFLIIPEDGAQARINKIVRELGWERNGEHHVYKQITLAELIKSLPKRTQFGVGREYFPEPYEGQ